MKKILSAALCAALLISSLSGCGKNNHDSDVLPPMTPQEETTLTSFEDSAICLGGYTDRILPASADGAGLSIVYHLFQGLYQYDSTGSIVNAIAEAESADESGCIWTFTLRSDAVWSDGQPVRAHDFVYAWRRAVSPATQSNDASLFMNIANASSILEGQSDPSTLGVAAVDDTHLQVTFATPVYRVSSLFVHHAFYPLREDLAASYMQDENSLFDPSALVTNGAYTVESFTQEKTVLKKSNTYFDAVNVQNKNICIVFLEDTDTQYQNFINEDLIFCENAAQNAVSANYGIDHTPITAAASYQMTYLVANNRVSPFDLADIRKAFSLSVRHRDFMQELLGYGIAPQGVMPSSFQDALSNEPYYNETRDLLTTSDADYAQNLLLAKQLLANNGYENPSAFPHVQLLYDRDNFLHAALAQLLKNCWNENLQIAVELKAVDAQTLQEALQGDDFSLVLFDLTAKTDDPKAILPHFVTGAHQNIGHFSSFEYDRLMQAAANAASISEQYAFYHQAETLLLDQAAVLPLMCLADLDLQSTHLTGIVKTPNGANIFTWAQIDTAL